jgi:hypothetical protein
LEKDNHKDQIAFALRVWYHTCRAIMLFDRRFAPALRRDRETRLDTMPQGMAYLRGPIRGREIPWV